MSHSKRSLSPWISPALKCMMLAWLAVPLAMASTSTYYLDTSRLELTVSPETGAATGAVKVSSYTDHPIRLRVVPKLWQLSPQGVVTYVEPPTSGFNLLDNIRVNPEEFALLPGKSRLVRFVAKPPVDVENGESYFQLYFEPVDQLEAKAGGQVAGVNNILDVVPVFTTTVYVYKGNPQPDVTVNHFQCGYQPTTGLLSVDFNLENQGKKHARLFGNVLVSPQSADRPDQPDQKDEPLDVLHLNNSTLLIVFPGYPRHVQEALKSKKLENGAYQLDLQLVDERNVQPAIHGSCDFTVSR